jgi:hypothetical protein
MALVQVTASAISGRKLSGSTQSLVINSENIYDWEDLTSGSRMRYVVNPHDRRDKALLITISEAISAKLAQANTAYGDIMIKLPVEATAGGATTDRYIPVKSITWCEAHGSDTDRVYVSYTEGGFKTVTVMVPFSLNDLLYVSSTGTSSS